MNAAQTREIQDSTMQQRCNIFFQMAKDDNKWVLNCILRFLQFYKERVERRQITVSPPNPTLVRSGLTLVADAAAAVRRVLLIATFHSTFPFLFSLDSFRQLF
jgi:hypothetical protein